MLNASTLSQANLLICPDWAHLQDVARELSKSFNSADVFYLNAPNVEATLEFIDKVQLGAVGERKLMIVTDASKQNIQSQNKMLKTLEEPRADTVFLLLAADEGKILPTVRSRCNIVRIDAPPAKDDIPSHITEAAVAFLKCKTVDDALLYVAILGAKENVELSLVALSRATRCLQIHKKIAIIRRNIAANCNPQNAFDLLVMEVTCENK